MARLTWDSPVEVWLKMYGSYDLAISLRAQSTKSRRDLESLDKIVANFATVVHERTPACLMKTELAQLMSWKLKRGKFRPNLLNLIELNAEELVTDRTAEALVLMKGEEDAVEAVNVLQELKGIGPATASGILAAVYPEKVAFMSDEAMAQAPSTKNRIEYTSKAFMNFNADAVSKAQLLQSQTKAKEAMVSLSFPPEERFAHPLIDGLSMSIVSPEYTVSYDQFPAPILACLGPCSSPETDLDPLLRGKSPLVFCHPRTLWTRFWFCAQSQETTPVEASWATAATTVAD